MTRRLPTRLHACLALWAAMALWLVPASARARVAEAAVRTTAAHVAVDVACTSERVDAAVRAPSMARARAGHGAIPLVRHAAERTPRRAADAVAGVAPSARASRARRLVFPTLANPPTRARA